MAPTQEFKPLTHFLRPQYVYLSLASLVLIHVLTLLTEVPAGVQLVVQSLACLYIGAMATSKIKYNKQNNKLEKEEKQSEEKMTQKDALQFPIYLSAYLFGLYLLLKYLDEAILKTAITLFFSAVGVLCLMGIIEDAIERLFPIEYSTKIVIDKKINLNLILTSKDIDIKLTKLNFISLLISMFPLAFYLGSKNWICNNLFGIAFTVSGVANFTVIPNFKIAYLMLWGLFFYDIFWVYGTDVMVTVAKSIDAPIKLQFPFTALNDEGNPFTKYSILGLGDIVVPGIFVGMCLKYDVDRQIEKVKKISEIKITYFLWCFVGYAIGIVTTLAVMILSGHAQPALLFLVPGCTLSVLIKAYLDKSLLQFWAYEADPEKPNGQTSNTEPIKNK
ncbi:unnamed protein product [Paramecium pentaurelia]|uniref:Signal peptide peptidase n=1 Tax=Paramecium pentaurelia TaxID=43138 RepID=A0A8S1T892_9CILI|nr:unnamed protein product [Paramecium pentaurelia]